MKSVKKSILLVICALALVTASVFGTLAYLTDTAEVVNTFTVGNVSITLDETKVNPDGEPITDKDDNPERTEEGNKYHMIPGKTYDKDPTVTVLENSEESYVRMIVTITDYADVEAVFGKDFLPQNFVEGWEPDVWLTTGVITKDTTANTATYEFRYHTTVDGHIDDDNSADTPDRPGDAVLEPLFTKFTVPGELTGDQMALISEMEIRVVGEAIQAAGFVDVVDAEGNVTATAADVAWAAFDAQTDKDTEATPAPPAAPPQGGAEGPEAESPVLSEEEDGPNA